MRARRWKHSASLRHNTMRIHQLKREHPNKKSRQIGRGGKRGKTAGRGTKGQKARAGHKIRPEIRDRIKKLPKRRGYKFSVVSDKPRAVNLAAIDRRFNAGESVTPATLAERGLLRLIGKKVPAVKVLATGTVSRKLSFTGLPVSAQARKKIEAAGGSIS